MKKVIVASENPIKIAVAKRAFAGVYPDENFEFVAVKSESGVSDQPMNEETEQGASNRLNFIRDLMPEADFWISQEGGIYEDGERLYNRAWIAVCDKAGYVYIREGMELGVANDVFFNSVNSKQGIGAIGFLTDGLIDREAYYTQAAVIALSEIKHQAWYKK
jgi:inosine/xanthosine triphosphatase